jgi:hypothetical protein
MLEYIFKNKSAWRTWGPQLFNVTIMPEKTWKWQRLEGKHTALQIA